MSLKIENCKPINVYLPANNITLQEVRTLLPEAIEILANYGIQTTGSYWYRILMPYKFTTPTSPVFADRLYINVYTYTGFTEVQPGTEVLAQDVAYISDEVH